jgi:hypothetical protein
VLGEAQHEPVQAALDPRHPRDDTRGQPVGHLRADAAHDVAHQQAGVADLESESAGLGIEGRAMGVERRAPHQRPELGRPDHRPRSEVHDRSQRDQVRAAPTTTSVRRRAAALRTGWASRVAAARSAKASEEKTVCSA